MASNYFSLPDVPPRPSSPYPVRVTSTSVTLAWDEPDCDGGHTVTGFTIRYRKTFQEYLTVINMYIYNVDPSYRNYTVIDLETFTSYNFSIQAISSEYRPTEFSLDNIITTATAGRVVLNTLQHVYMNMPTRETLLSAEFNFVECRVQNSSIGHRHPFFLETMEPFGTRGIGKTKMST